MYIGTDRSLLTEDNDPLSHNIQLAIFYMNYHIYIITHGMAFGEPVGGPGESKLMTSK